MKKARLAINLVKIYGFGSSLVLSGFMAWFFYTLANGSVWLVSPDEWNEFEFILSLLSCITITIMMLDYVKDNKALRHDMKVSKVLETTEYGEIYTVALPVRFFFTKDGSYDGIEVHVEHASQRDQDLVKELCAKLSNNGQQESE